MRKPNNSERLKDYRTSYINRPHRLEIDSPAEVAQWALNEALPRTLVWAAFGKGGRKCEVAAILGVSPPSVSQWTLGKGQMSRAVKVHLLRLLGIAWKRGQWVRVREFTEGEAGYTPKTRSGKRAHRKRLESRQADPQ